MPFKKFAKGTRAFLCISNQKSNYRKKQLVPKSIASDLYARADLLKYFVDKFGRQLDSWFSSKNSKQKKNRIILYG